MITIRKNNWFSNTGNSVYDIDVDDCEYEEGQAITLSRQELFELVSLGAKVFGVKIEDPADE